VCRYERRPRIVQVVLLAGLLVIYRVVYYRNQQEGHAYTEVPVQLLTPCDEVGINPLLSKYELVCPHVKDRSEEEVNHCRG